MSLKKEDILEQVAETADSSPSTARRGFVGGALATLGLAGIGSVSATSEPTVAEDKRRLERTAQPLLDRLSGDDLLETADASALPDAELTVSSTAGTTIVESESGPQRAFVTRVDDGKLEVNLGGAAMEPYAIHRPESAESQIYLPDSDGSYETRPFGSSKDDDVSTDQIADCDGCDCYSNNSCWWDKYVTICSSIENGDCVSTSDCTCKL
ncbi:hypothetical protein [Halobaculum sp. MBLA0143]|uniref:hypothetical protein n=1 Tax=Halobaculum sp. MBLA0143 TaxID=3079933 RepID=UPI0035265E7E